MDPSDMLSQIRSICQQRGSAGVKGLGQMLGVYNRPQGDRIPYEEFENALAQYGCELSPEDIGRLFTHFDPAGEGTIDIDTFFREIRPTMSPYRKNLALSVFQMIDNKNGGSLSIQDIRGAFEVKKHPRYLSGEMTAKEVFESFLRDFEIVEGDEVTMNEWLDYYAGVGSTIDKDVYFDFMIRQIWKV